MPMSASVEVRERIRWSDIDIAGIMYFGTYTRLFEIGETELFRAMGFPLDGDAFSKLGYWFLRLNFHTDFHAPAFIDDEVVISICWGMVSKRSARMEFKVQRASDDVALGSGYCTVACVKISERKSMSIPDDLRAEMMKYYSAVERDTRA